ncbi:MAG: hypothetical protein IJD43_02615 [Thermoguttaceae bacterium]|nr:hypothetical protein [Planctomycetaceae bacterium]MBQ4142346.1 hypothetical protein [Thermoguttaceae bacterium]
MKEERPQDEFLPEDGGFEELPSGETDDFASDEWEETAPALDEFQAENGETAENGIEELDPNGGTEFESEPENAMTEEEEAEEEKPVMYRPPRMDLYTVLLVLSLLFISLAAAIHYLECPPTEYGAVPFKKGPVVSAPGN